MHFTGQATGKLTAKELLADEISMQIGVWARYRKINGKLVEIIIKQEELDIESYSAEVKNLSPVPQLIAIDMTLEQIVDAVNKKLYP
jgi:hypothetical protein